MFDILAISSLLFPWAAKRKLCAIEDYCKWLKQIELLLCYVYCEIMGVKDNRKHTSSQNKSSCLFLISHIRKLFWTNGSMLLSKSGFKRKKLAISHFTGNKLSDSQITKICFTSLYGLDLFFEDFSHFSLALKWTCICPSLVIFVFSNSGWSNRLIQHGPRGMFNP